MSNGEIIKLNAAKMSKDEYRTSGDANIFKRSAHSDVKPSPYIQALVKSSFKGNGDPKGLNDSLDKL